MDQLQHAYLLLRWTCQLYRCVSCLILFFNHKILWLICKVINVIQLRNIKTSKWNYICPMPNPPTAPTIKHFIFIVIVLCQQKKKKNQTYLYIPYSGIYKFAIISWGKRKCQRGIYQSILTQIQSISKHVKLVLKHCKSIRYDTLNIELQYDIVPDLTWIVHF